MRRLHTTKAFLIVAASAACSLVLAVAPAWGMDEWVSAGEFRLRLDGSGALQVEQGGKIRWASSGGHNVPVISQEGGVGRGHPVLSPLIDTFLPGSAGNAYSTYYAAPVYMTSDYRSLFLENTEFSQFDRRASRQTEMRLFGSRMTGRILAGNSYPHLIERYTARAGRMRPLPDWFNEGATIGLQGGTAKVNAILDELERRGTPIAGVWLQDWVGKRKTSLGSQLWWNWELDRTQYPAWDALADRVEKRGGRMLCYMLTQNVTQLLGYSQTDGQGRRRFQVSSRDAVAAARSPLHPSLVSFVALRSDATDPEPVLYTSAAQMMPVEKK